MRTFVLFLFLILGFSVSQAQPPCGIYDLVVTDVSCNQGADTYTLTLNFGFGGTAETFNVYGSNNTFVGNYAYADLPLTITNYPATTTANLVVKVQNIETPNCFDVVEMPVPDCGTNTDCSITNLMVTELSCNENGETYTLVLDFDYANTNQNGFDVFAPGNVFVGYYLYADLPVAITNFPATSNVNTAIKVVNNDNPDCFKALEFAAPDCGATACTLENLDFTTYYGDVGAQIVINSINVLLASNEYSAYYNDVLIDNFNLADLPDYTIDYTFFCGDTIALSIVNTANPACAFAIEFFVPMELCVATNDVKQSKMQLNGVGKIASIENVMPVTAQWCNMLGQVIEVQAINTTSWSFEDKPAGLYVLRVQDADGRIYVGQWVNAH